MKADRCPHCRGVLPEAKTCADETCRRTFYRGEGGRTDAMFCTERCAARTRMRRMRQRNQESEREL